MKLTIRDFLWLILVCGIGLSWLRSDRKWAAEMRAANEKYAKWQDSFRDESKTLLSDYHRIISDPEAHEYFLQRRQLMDKVYLRGPQNSPSAPGPADETDLPYSSELSRGKIEWRRGSSQFKGRLP